MSDNWRLDALCAEVDSELFFPERHADDGREARRVCGLCEAREECLTYALVNYVEFGIWGGLGPSERRALRPPVEPAPCGTYGGYKRHLRNDEEVCGPCGQARRDYRRDLATRHAHRRVAA